MQILDKSQTLCYNTNTDEAKYNDLWPILKHRLRLLNMDKKVWIVQARERSNPLSFVIYNLKMLWQNFAHSQSSAGTRSRTTVDSPVTLVKPSWWFSRGSCEAVTVLRTVGSIHKYFAIILSCKPIGKDRIQQQTISFKTPNIQKYLCRNFAPSLIWPEANQMTRRHREQLDDSKTRNHSK